MKIRRSFLGLIAVMAALIILALWHGKKQPAEASPSTSVETNATPPATIEPIQPVGAPTYTNVPTVKTVTGTNVLQTPPQGKWEQIKPILAAQNDVPIVFYGRLEDQFGSPVADAQVAASIRIENGIEHTVNRFSLSSDANGLFTVSGYNGQDLSIVPQKAGYALASLNGGGIYSHLWPESQRIHPNPNNPVVIKMWKLQGAEPLVSISQHYKLPYTNGPINFDLLAGQYRASGGDIKITVNRPEGDVSERNRQDWSVLVEVVNGGLVDSSGQDAVTYAAPESGYEPSETLEFSVAQRTWSEMFNQGFFVQSRNGQVYSKLGISFRINSAPDDFMNITFGGVANTNSSRNWEATIPQP